jgi:2,4-dienoyl-CoA reductase-like NADH-dependent reductase (Old Yellow Enzyme family)
MNSRQSYAPFGSVSVRVKKQKPKPDQPGPGSYDVSLPIIIPIVQTIRKKNNNVIVKLGHLGTASFQSDQKRFKSEYLPSIGPGQCTQTVIQTVLRNQKSKRQWAHTGAWQYKR